jgi:phosphatidylserine decarboxylase
MKLIRLVGLCLLLVSLFLMYFFRKPPILYLPAEHNVIRSPAFGRVIKLFTQPDDTLVISIFLSPFDIHYQQAPCEGLITNIEYDATGKFELAYNETKSRDNEKAIISMQIPQGIMKIYQIAGFLVRRIDTYVQPGDQVHTAQLLGLIKFGSRVDLILPQSSRFLCVCAVGQMLQGVSSVIGRYR